MSKKITHFGRICVTYVLVLAIVFSFVMSSFVGLGITASAEGTSPNPSAFDLWEGNKPTSLDGLNMKGEGTKASPYEVTNPDQLWFAVNNTDATKYFKVMNDININDVTNFDAWTDTNPDGVYDWNPTEKFVGNFDGNKKTITGLYSSCSADRIGLFAMLGDNAIITNVIIDKAYFTNTKASGMTFVGGLVGTANNVTGVYIYGCIVKNSKLTNIKTGDGGVGGLIGSSYATGSAHVDIDTLTVVNSYAVDNTIGGAASWNAGLVASYWSKNVNLINCFTTGMPIGHQPTGTAATNCYVSGDSVTTPYLNGGSFTDGKVEKITSTEMKGDSALTNMNLLAKEWDVTDGYPVPKAYRDVYTFLESDKVVEDTAFAGGNGSKNNPYQITNAPQLWKAVNNTDATKYFKVMNDIVVNNTDDFSTWSDSSTFVDWNPTTKFVGNFDGNNKTIKGLYSSCTNTNIGLFSTLGDNAVITNVIIDQAYLSYTSSSGSQPNVGGLAGSVVNVTGVYVYGCVVKNSVIKNNKNGDGGLGGLIGASFATGSAHVDIDTLTVINSYAVDNTFGGSAAWQAGLVASYWSKPVTLTNCFTTDKPIGHQSTGTTATNCYISGDAVTAPYWSGGSFADGKVEKIANADMKGTAALTNMNLSSFAWTAVENDYPLPVLYKLVYAFTESDKDTTQTDFAGGTGTRNDPYQITNPAQLWKAVNNTDASLYFKVMNDININDVSAFSEWTNSSTFVDWDPANTFAGTFDGNKMTIKGLYASSAAQYLGLFSRVAANAFIYDVIIDHAYVAHTGNMGMAMTGALVGSASAVDNVKIYGCIVKNSVIKGRGGAAGFVGGAFRNSGDACTITLTSCYAVDNTITGASWPSGLIGARWGVQKSVITDCFTTNIHLEHQSSSATVTNCYVSGDVDKPFFNSSDAFTDGKVEKIDNADMKGTEALTNMNLDSFGWTAVPNDYPMPKPYASIAGGFIAADKNMDEVTFVGTGAMDDPYQITNAAELWKAVHNTDATKHFKVMNDITINDVSGFADWHNALAYEDWNPDVNTKFVGTFNGNQKVIKGLYGTGAYKYLGLFARLGDNALIYDVIVDHAYFRTTAGAMSTVGGLVGAAHNTTGVYIYGCIVKNSKLLNSHTGDAGEAGLVGGAFSTRGASDTITLENCYAVDNTLNGTCNWSSGLMASRWTSKSVMINCFTTDYALEHQRASATATNCYVSGNVEYPFSFNDTTAFGTAGVYKIDNADMKGDLALENMNLSSATWTIVPDSYPMPKPYVLEKDAWAGEKAVTSFVQLEGDGTKESPYLITNGDELWFAVNNTAKIGAANDKIPYFRLENDIKLNQLYNYRNWGTEAPANAWLSSGAFVGHFNGNYKTITGLFAAPTSEATAGLFAALESGSTITNLTLDKSYIKAENGSSDLVVGGIVGTIDGKSDVKLQGVTVKNTNLEGRGCTGGIVGLITNSTGAVVVERAASVDNTITDVNGAEFAAGLVGNVVANAANTAVIAHSFTTSNFISRQSVSAIFNNVYTTDDVAKPFAAEDTAFGTSVKAIALADMKGDNAVTNMALDAGYWNNVADSYPVVKPYVNPNNFTEADKTLTLADLDGEGTKDKPYEITTPAELWVAVNNTDASLYFKVMNDIEVNDISEFAAWNDSSAMVNWNPSEKFSGYFDGNKKVISGLFASSSTDKYLGLFGQLGSEVRIIDVIIENAYFAQTSTSAGSMSAVGGLVGRAIGTSDVIIYGCVVKNSCIYNRYAGGAGEGGLIGAAYSTSPVGDIEVANCYAVDNKQAKVCTWSSGLIAARWTTKMKITDCFTTDNTLEHQYSSVTTINCYVAGDVEYPFTLDPKGTFGDATGVYKIDKAQMKGANALDNMKLSSANWKATDSYPESLIKFKDNDGTVGQVWSGALARTFAGGSGTEEDPWLVDTPERFAKMISSYGSSEHWFKLTADIKINDTTASDWYKSDSVNNWIIGKKFIGHVDGQGHTVTGLYVNHSQGFTGGAGLIPQASGNATITNINLDKCYVVGNKGKESYTGALVGYVPSGLVRIAGCNVSNVLVDSVNRFGGILGASSTAVVTIDYCTFQGQKIGGVNYGTNYIGGLIGDSWGTTIATNCVSKGIVAIGKAGTATYGVYSDVSQTEAFSKKVGVIQLSAEEMIGNSAKTSMDKLKWKYFNTNANGIPTAKNNIDLSTSATMGTPGAVWSGFMAPGYAGGTGTIGDPYIVETAEQLYRFTLESKARFTKEANPTYVKITRDIYFNDVSNENWKEKNNLNIWLGATNLGGGTFYGHLDGDYHVVYGLYSVNETEGNAAGLIPVAGEASTISKLGFSEGYMMNPSISENYQAAFIGFIGAKGKQNQTMEEGTYNPITFTECFVDDTFEVTGFYAGGFVGGSPMGVNFKDCYSNVYIEDGAKYSGAFIGNAFDIRYYDTFHNCYSFPASKWTSFSSLHLITDPDTKAKGPRNGAIKNSYYFGSSNKYFELVFYKDMFGDTAKTSMPGLDFVGVWKTVDGGTPVLRGFANADDFSSNREVKTTVSFVSGAEEISVQDMEGTALSPFNPPVLEREGYFFGGWYVYEEGACEYDYGVFPVTDTTLYAKWNANSVSQNFENYVNTKYDYQDDYVYYRPGVEGYSSLKVHGGGKAMLRKGESSEEQDVIINATDPVAAGEEYRITFWVTTEQADAKATVSLVHYTWPDFEDPNLGVEKMVDVESLEVGKWTSYTYKFKALTPWIGIRTTGNAQLYMDDFFITPVAEFMKDPSKVNDYDYFYNLGETEKTSTSKTLSGINVAQVNTLAPVSAVSTEDTNNTIAFLVTVILAASALVVLSRVSLENTQQEVETDIED
ncbi:MAG: InlB B-repeat-containing protein [Clostridia bacterium]|nr:InlB B-repeat-containing protein [Clostridia bacterium]